MAVLGNSISQLEIWKKEGRKYFKLSLPLAAKQLNLLTQQNSFIDVTDTLGLSQTVDLRATPAAALSFERGAGSRRKKSRGMDGKTGTWTERKEHGQKERSMDRNKLEWTERKELDGKV